MFLSDHLAENYSLQQASLEIVVIVVGAMVLGFLLGYSYSMVSAYLYWFSDRYSNHPDNQSVDLVALRETAAKQYSELKFDNFQRLIGIDGHIQQLLYHYGIRTYKDLERTSPDVLKAILNEAAEPYSELNPGTWPVQAKISAMGNWDQLANFQHKTLGQ